MSYFYLMVDRLDEPTLCAAYFPMGTDPDQLPERVGWQLERYRDKGFQIVHFSHRPSYKRARRADGIALEIILIQRDKPIELKNFNLGLENNDDAAIH